MTAVAPAVAAPDLTPVRCYWHPCAASDDVKDKPIGVTLLGEDLVLFRSEGRVHAFSDICVHRGTRLSLGWVTDDGCLQCPYHGWVYNTTGKCVYIPSQPRDAQHIPSRARAIAYRAEERYGLVWVAMDEPKLPIPEYPEYEDPEFHTWSKYYGGWDASPGRLCENSLDIAHLDFAHPGLLGDPDDPNSSVIRPYETRVDDGGVWTMFYKELPPAAETFAEEGDRIRHETRVDFPFVFTVRIFSKRGRVALFFATNPIRSDECGFWLFESRDYDRDEPDDRYIAFNDLLESQDRRVIVTQRPEMVPTDLSEELHVKVADAGSIEYRRMLKRHGISFA